MTADTFLERLKNELAICQQRLGTPAYEGVVKSDPKDLRALIEGYEAMREALSGIVVNTDEYGFADDSWWQSARAALERKDTGHDG